MTTCLRVWSFDCLARVRFTPNCLSLSHPPTFKSGKHVWLNDFWFNNWCNEFDWTVQLFLKVNTIFKELSKKISQRRASSTKLKIISWINLTWLASSNCYIFTYTFFYHTNVQKSCKIFPEPVAKRSISQYSLVEFFGETSKCDDFRRNFVNLKIKSRQKSNTKVSHSFCWAKLILKVWANFLSSTFFSQICIY